MAGQIDYANIVATDASDWHYDIPDGYFDNIGGTDGVQINNYFQKSH